VDFHKLYILKKCNLIFLLVFYGRWAQINIRASIKNDNAKFSSEKDRLYPTKIIFAGRNERG